MMEMIHKSANISNLSNLNSDLKVFYHDTSTEKDEINNNNTHNNNSTTAAAGPTTASTFKYEENPKIHS